MSASSSRHNVEHGPPSGVSSNTDGTEQVSVPKRHDNKIYINVGGVKHETYKSTLRNIPDTRLSWLTQTTANNADYDPVTKEFFFDRHPGVFLAILNYYRTGKLHCPNDVCGPLFEEELQFWGIDEKQIEPCCWSTYTQHRDAQETLAKLNGPDWEENDLEEDEEDVAKRFGIEESGGFEKDTWWERWQPRMWTLLEEPYSNLLKRLLAVISLMFVCVSITTFCLETVSDLQEPVYSENAETNTTEIIDYKPRDELFYIEAVCVTFFTVEIIVRFIFSPSKLDFYKTAQNIIDFLAIVPFYVDAICKIANVNVSGTANDILSFARIVRIFRIGKLTRHFSGLKILVHTIRASAKELLLLIIFLGLGVLVFASLEYYAEKWLAEEGQTNDFTDIPIGFWWAVVTMTTVGYGDMVPRTPSGMLVGAIAGVFGVLTIALPVPVIVNNFALYYTHAQARAKLPKKRKRVLVGAADALKTQGQTFSSISGYSTQSTNEAEAIHDSVSESSEDSGVKTRNPKTANGQSTGISVTFTDEVTDSPKTTRKKSPNTGKRGTGRRESFVPNGLGVGRRESFRPNGSIAGRSKSLHGPSKGPPARRRSLLPSMTEIDV
uniref:Potassium voltage-gated channel protein Shaw-like n=1 Tax=Saccoglossus kowalevskii TaxID=10224 RepID=A0ABM0MV87_SACKO|nr:PREDICTED: potassium voltage-gated channel protein Shaw-like [Saccoglossus kowalevskii]